MDGIRKIQLNQPVDQVSNEQAEGQNTGQSATSATTDSIERADTNSMFTIDSLAQHAHDLNSLLIHSKSSIYSYLSGGLLGEIPTNFDNQRSVFSELKAFTALAKSEIAQLPGMNHLTLESRYKDVSELLEKHSDKTQIQIEGTEKKINEEETAASDSKESTESARDRRRTALDNIQKLLDIIHSMNPQL